MAGMAAVITRLKIEEYVPMSSNDRRIIALVRQMLLFLTKINGIDFFFSVMLVLLDT